MKEIACRTGVAPEVAEKRLESLADKGVVFAREKDGEWGYAHVNTFHDGKTTGFSGSPVDIMEYGMRLLQEQGKLEAFIGVSTTKAE